MQNALEVEHLSVSFGATEVLHDLDFAVPRGSSVAIIGPNGAGKTVLFRALVGAIPFRGTVRWAPGLRLGYVPQKLDLERDLPVTGLDLLRAKAAITGTDGAQVADALTRADLSPELAREQIGTFSGGQFQRLLVALALVGKPDVLLLDEPTAGVDEPGQVKLNELVHQLQQDAQLTVLLISHDLSVVYRYADVVLCLGRTQTCLGPPRQILTPELLHGVYGSPVEYHVHGG